MRPEIIDDRLTVEECGQLGAQAAEEMQCTSIPISELDQIGVSEMVDEANRSSRLSGSVDTERKYALFRLPDSLSRAWSPSEAILVMPWCWAGDFGASITLSVRFKESNVTSMLFVPRDSSFVSVLAKREFVAIFVKGAKIMAAYTINFESPLAARVLLSHLQAARESVPQIFRDDKTHFLEVLKAQSVYLKQHGKPTDRLSVGWAVEFARRCHIIKTIIGDPATRNAIQNVSDGESTICRIVQQVAEHLPRLRDCIDFLRDGDHGLSVNPTRLLYHLSELAQDFPEESDRLSFLLISLLELAINFDTSHDVGKTVRWLKPNGEVAEVQIVPSAFPDGSDAIDYWPEINWSPPFWFGYGIAFTGEDFPVSTSEIGRELSAFPQAEDANESLEHADFLFKEAMVDKRGTIPYEASVQLRLGPFEFVQLSEVGDDIYVTFRTTDGRVLGSIISLDTGSTYLELPPSVECDNGTRLRIEAAITLLITAIIRDFFVVEHRERVFTEKRIESRSKAGKQMPKQRIVYLPRVKYTHKPNLSASKKQLGQAERASHFVKPHIRKAASASDYQKILAERYNIHVPEGYTFVRPHERGRHKRETVYRSRSAMQSLFVEMGPTTSKGGNQWFQFERDVCSLMQKLGFRIKHIAAGRNGDKGIDVLAVKGSDIDLVTWVIQCKCWNPKRKVMPATVRELAGVLSLRHAGTRGMIVTTSDFSSGAVEEAERHSIRLMAGEEFASRLIDSSE